MADISKADLKKEISAILEGADLTTTTAKKIRQQVEEKLDVNLSSRKKEIDEIVMQCLEDKQNEKKSAGKGAKKNGKKAAAADDDDDEEGDDDEEAASDAEEDDDEEGSEEEEEKPKKRAAAPKKPAAKKRKADSDDESEAGSEDEDAKDDDYSPASKKKAAPKKKKASKGGKKGKGKGKKGGSDSDSDEDWGKKKKKAGAGGPKKTAFTKDCNLSPELAAIVGSDVMPRHEVVKRVWAYIKEKNLYDPTNKQFCVCDADLQKVVGVKKFRTFGMMKYLKTHFID